MFKVNFNHAKSDGTQTNLCGLQFIRMLKVVVLASGNGTNLQAIVDASKNRLINIEVVLVLSDVKQAYALTRAERCGIEGVFIDSKDATKHEKYMSKLLEQKEVDLVVGAGYMRILSPIFINEWYGRLINIHPSLLPSFKGVDGQKQAFEYGVKLAGCTTHFMDERTDHGPIILQAAVKVHNDDTRETLAQRILKVEHQLLPRSIDLFEQGRIIINGRRVHILPGDSWRGAHEYDDVFYPMEY